MRPEGLDGTVLDVDALPFDIDAPLLELLGDCMARHRAEEFPALTGGHANRQRLALEALPGALCVPAFLFLALFDGRTPALDECEVLP